jgi:Zn finger protein HypA/HybF involved in hydrogenase expression
VENISNNLGLKEAQLSINPIENNENKIYFVICNSCYWCASYFGTDDLESLSGSSSHVLDCPTCNSHNTEVMPIATDESFRIEYSLTRGMEMEFYRSNKIVVRHQSTREFQMREVPV